jgi:putative nucleotidyltransferase with HDIG domain
MANSPLFGRRKTETIKDAVVVLGLKRVEAILLSCSLNRVLVHHKWGLDPVIFWRHSLGCALVSRRMAQLINYPDPEKAYLAGLLHDVGIVVNALTCAEENRTCLEDAIRLRVPLHHCEQEIMGFTHCETGKILATQWHFSEDVASTIEFHHNVNGAERAQPLVFLVHLSDLLCRLRDLGYGYYEAMGVELATDVAWTTLLQGYPALGNLDVARLSMDIDGAMEEIRTVVDAVFRSA